MNVRSSPSSSLSSNFQLTQLDDFENKNNPYKAMKEIGLKSNAEGSQITFQSEGIEQENLTNSSEQSKNLDEEERTIITSNSEFDYTATSKTASEVTIENKNILSAQTSTADMVSTKNEELDLDNSYDFASTLKSSKTWPSNDSVEIFPYSKKTPLKNEHFIVEKYQLNNKPLDLDININILANDNVTLSVKISENNS